MKDHQCPKCKRWVAYTISGLHNHMTRCGASYPTPKRVHMTIPAQYLEEMRDYYHQLRAKA